MHIRGWSEKLRTSHTMALKCLRMLKEGNDCSIATRSGELKLLCDDVWLKQAEKQYSDIASALKHLKPRDRSLDFPISQCQQGYQHELSRKSFPKRFCVLKMSQKTSTCRQATQNRSILDVW